MNVTKFYEIDSIDFFIANIDEKFDEKIKEAAYKEKCVGIFFHFLGMMVDIQKWSFSHQWFQLLHAP